MVNGENRAEEMSEVMRQKILERIARFPNRKNYEIAKSLNLVDGRRVVSADVQAARESMSEAERTTAEAPKYAALDDVVSKYDAVGDALLKVGAVPERQLISDDDLRRELGLGYDRWRRVRGSARLAGHWHQMPDKSLLWGRKATITTLAERLKELA